MATLAVIPGGPLQSLFETEQAGSLGKYYNPLSFFDKVVILSPFENDRREVDGMPVIPTADVQLRARIREERVGLVRVFGGGVPAEMAVFHREPEVPVVVSIHDKRLEKIRPAVRFADAVFAASEELRSDLVIYGVRPERLFVVPGGVDLGLMRPLPPSETADLAARYPFRRKLLHVGHKSPDKDIGSLIRALARLGPDYGLVAIGQGDASLSAAVAEKEGVADRCVFLPGVPGSDRVRFYNWADCVCHFGCSEAMCGVLMEALACSVPLVTTVKSSAGLGAGPDNAALLLDDPENDTVLAKRIRCACENETVNRTLRAGGRGSVEHLSRERVLSHEAECYRRVIDMGVNGDLHRGYLEEGALLAADIGRRLRGKNGGI